MAEIPQDILDAADALMPGKRVTDSHMRQTYIQGAMAERAKHRWRDANVEPPEEGQHCIFVSTDAYRYGGQAFGGEYKGYSSFIKCHQFVVVREHFTARYWQPMPEFPDELKNV